MSPAAATRIGRAVLHRAVRARPRAGTCHGAGYAAAVASSDEHTQRHGPDPEEARPRRCATRTSRSSSPAASPPGCAAGPPTDHDLDFLIKPEDADRALDALTDAGLRPEKPPEEWLYKAYDGDVLVDLIFWPAGLDIDDEVIERGEEREVEAMTMRVMRPEDLLVTKLMRDDRAHDQLPQLPGDRARAPRADRLGRRARRARTTRRSAAPSS